MHGMSTNIPAPAATAGPMRAQGFSPHIGGGAGFESALTGAKGAAGEDELRTAAEQLVSHALLLPLMKLMRDDPFRTDLFHGGQAEEMFAAQLDQHLAEDMAGRMGLPVVDAVYERFAGRMTAGMGEVETSPSRSDKGRDGRERAEARGQSDAARRLGLAERPLAERPLTRSLTTAETSYEGRLSHRQSGSEAVGVEVDRHG